MRLRNPSGVVFLTSRRDEISAMPQIRLMLQQRVGPEQAKNCVSRLSRDQCSLGFLDRFRSLLRNRIVTQLVNSLLL